VLRGRSSDHWSRDLSISHGGQSTAQHHLSPLRFSGLLLSFPWGTERYVIIAPLLPACRGGLELARAVDSGRAFLFVPVSVDDGMWGPARLPGMKLTLHVEVNLGGSGYRAPAPFLNRWSL
jgi:hypothetical protein